MTGGSSRHEDAGNHGLTAYIRHPYGQPRFILTGAPDPCHSKYRRHSMKAWTKLFVTLGAAAFAAATGAQEIKISHQFKANADGARPGHAGVREGGQQARHEPQVPDLPGAARSASSRWRSSTRCKTARWRWRCSRCRTRSARRGVLDHHHAGHGADARPRDEAASGTPFQTKLQDLARRQRHPHRDLVVDPGRVRNQGSRDHRTEERAGPEDARRRSDVRDACSRRRARR